MSFFSGTKRNLLALALSMGATGVAHAQVTANGCFTPVGGILGTAPDVGVIGQGTNDASWNGSFGFGWETGAMGVAEFKAISDQRNQRLYLSWRRKITATKVAGTEGVQVGFGYKPAGSSDQLSQIIRVKFGSLPGDTVDMPTPKGPDGFIHGVAPASVELFYKVGPGATKGWASPSKQWVTDNTRMYVLQDSVDNGLYWVVQMVVPVKQTAEADPTVTGNQWTTPGVYLGDALPAPTQANPNPPTKPFPYWADIIESLDPNTQTVIVRSYPDPGISSSTMPNWQLQNRDGTTTVGTPSPDNWATMQAGSPSTNTCDAKGLSFLNSDIRNTTAATAGKWDGSLLLYSKTTSPATVTPSDNFFSVTVSNNSTVGVKPSDIAAAFSIAPYGSQAGARSAAWAPLNKSGNRLSCTTTGANATCTTPFDTQINATSTDGTATTGQFTLNTTDHWAPDQSYLCAVVDNAGKPYRLYKEFIDSGYCGGAPWLPNTQVGSDTTQWDGLPFHTCMQVELSTQGSGTTGIQFANKSAFRNMYAVPASKFREGAVIDTRGLPKGTTKVKGKAGHYVYLYTETRNMPYVIDPSKDEGPSLVKKAAFVPDQRGPEGPPTYDQLSKYYPTMAVHTFWDTGKTMTINKKKLAVLEPMTSYGNFVTHDYEGEGEIYGWDARLEGAEQVGAHTYRVFVPNEGRTTVTTNIEALPAPRCMGTVKASLIADLVKSLLQLLDSSTPAGSRLSVCLQPPVVQCSDLYSALDDLLAQNWGTLGSWVKLLVSQIKTASGCGC